MKVRLFTCLKCGPVWRTFEKLDVAGRITRCCQDCGRQVEIRMEPRSNGIASAKVEFKPVVN